MAGDGDRLARQRDLRRLDLKQRAATGELCGLGSDGREAVQSAADFDAFGAFTPVGAEVLAGSGELRRVIAAALNLRRVPTTLGIRPITRLREGQRVRVLGSATEPFLRVRAMLDGADVIGYASGRFLVPEGIATAPTPAPAPAVASLAGHCPAVHYREGDQRSRRGSDAPRPAAGEPGQPRRDPAADGTVRAAQMDAIVDWLDVEHSARYARTPEATFCNVHAADACYMTRVYLPRLWWTGSALHRLDAGEVPGRAVRRHGAEMRADDLMAWLIEFGSDFGWRRVFDANALQKAANQGGVGLI